MDKNNLNGALTGIAIAAATYWGRYDDDTQRRLRNVRDDAEEALERVQEMQSRGEVIRSRLPPVMDAQVGLALATTQPTAPAVIPSTIPTTRPELTSQMETAVAAMMWPPEPGEYDEHGLVKRAGELTPMFLALTYEEVRAWVQGMCQSRPPTREAKVQIFFAANALVAQLSGQSLTYQQYKDAWARLFGGQSVSLPQTPSPIADPHRDPTRPPTVVAFDSGITSVVPLGKPDLPAQPYEHRNCDQCFKFRLSVPAGPGLASGTSVLTIKFGAEFTSLDGKPIQPMVKVNDYRFYASSISSTNVVISNWMLVGQGTYDLFISSTGV